MRVPFRRISTARAVQRPASPLSLRDSVNQISAPPGAVATSATEQAVALRELEGAVQRLRAVAATLSDLARRLTSVQ